MFEHKGIKTELSFCQITKYHFIQVIDYLFEKYGIDNIEGKISLSNNGRPYLLYKNIYLAPTDNNLSYYQQLNFQLSHELTHLIQDFQKRGLQIKIKVVDNKVIQQPFPNNSIQETEAIANAVDVIENVLKYEGYNARQNEYPEYYDYDEAFRLVDSGEIDVFRKIQSKL